MNADFFHVINNEIDTLTNERRVLEGWLKQYAEGVIVFPALRDDAKEIAVSERIDTIRQAIADKRILIEEYQKICDHIWEYEGSDSHKNWYKCKICGHSDWD